MIIERAVRSNSDQSSCDLWHTKWQFTSCYPVSIILPGHHTHSSTTAAVPS